MQVIKFNRMITNYFLLGITLAALSSLPMSSYAMQDGDPPEKGSVGEGKQEPEDRPVEASEEQIDFLPSLPIELQVQVLFHCSYGDRRKLSQVCTAYKAIVEFTWTEKEIDAFKKLYDQEPWKITEIPILEVKAPALSAYVEYAKIVWGLQITQVNSDTPYFLAQFPNLTYLDLSGCPDAYSQVEVRVEGTVGIGKSKDILEDILKACPNLTTLKLSGRKGIPCLQYLHNLTKLTLVDTRIEAEDIQYLPETLTTLHLDGGDTLDHHLEKLPQQCPNLTTLYLEKSLDIINLSHLGGFSNLTDLSLSGCVNVLKISSLKNFVNLTKLNLSGCHQVMDLSALKSFPKLKTLVLHDGTILEKEKLEEFLSSL